MLSTGRWAGMVFPLLWQLLLASSDWGLSEERLRDPSSSVRAAGRDIIVGPRRSEGHWMREAEPPPCMGRGWRGSAAEQRPGLTLESVRGVRLACDPGMGDSRLASTRLKTASGGEL
jgi:hypothetical protein